MVRCCCARSICRYHANGTLNIIESDSEQCLVRTLNETGHLLLV